MGPRSFYVYILASRIGGTLYIGVTNDLVRRVAEHRLKLVESFTEKYDVVMLVYFEQFDDPENAIKREKRLKKWNRAWKIRLIEGKQSKLGRFVFWDCRCLNSSVTEYWIVRLRGR
jgi:putative endonuclease